MGYTDEQLNVIMEAQDEGGGSAEEVAAALKADGHPLFVPSLDDLGPPQALAVAETTALATSGRTGEGMEGFSREDLVIPRVKIKQPVTQGAEDVEDGMFFLQSDVESCWDSIELVVLRWSKDRAFMLPYNNAREEAAVLERIGRELPQGHKGPICASDDRVAPRKVHDDLVPLARDCEACPYSQWQEVKGQRFVDCKEGYRFLFFSTEMGVPLAWSARGSAIKPVKNLLTALNFACARHKTGIYAFRFTASTKRIEGKQGVYHVPVFGRPIAVSPEEADEFRKAREAFSSRGEEADA